MSFLARASRASWQLHWFTSNISLLRYFFSGWDSDLLRSQAKPLGSHVGSEAGTHSSDVLFFQPGLAVLCITFMRLSSLTVQRALPPNRMMLSPLSLGYAPSNHIFTTAATWHECDHPDIEGPTDRQKRCHVPPLTLCAVFSGWVMSHCSLLSLMQKAMGWSDWPHSATFISAVWIWSHTSHFLFSLLPAVINLLNQLLFKFPSPEIHNGRQICWAVLSLWTCCSVSIDSTELVIVTCNP